MVTHVPCGGDDIDPAGRILITASISDIDGPGVASGLGGPRGVWEECIIPKTGIITLDIADVDNWSEALATSVMLHEVGHVLGLG